MLIAEISLNVEDIAQCPVGNNPFHLQHAWEAALVVAERKWHSSLFRGLDGALGFSARESKRFLTPDWLARRSDCGNLSHMQGMRSCEKNDLYPRVGDRVFQVGC